MAKANVARAAIHAAVQTTFHSAQANENTRDGWNQEKYENKNLDTSHHYDVTRKDLNFMIDADGIKSLSATNTKKLYNKFVARLAELDFKAFDPEASNQPNSYIDWVFSGDHDVMHKMAFGDQDVALDLSRDNSHIVRKPEIEEFAKAVYKFACLKFGTDNVVGVEVHLDETTPHVHVNTIPTALRQQRGRATYLYVNKDDPNKTITSKEYKNLSKSARQQWVKGEKQEREQKLCVSFSGLVGDNRTERGRYLKQFHTDFYEQVGKHFGLARGRERETLTEEEAKDVYHKTAAELEAERREAMALQAEIDSLKNEKRKAENERNEALTKAAKASDDLDKTYAKIAENEKTISDQDTTITDNNTTIEQQQKDIEKAKKDYNDVTSWFYNRGLKPRKDYEAENERLLKKMELLKENHDTDVANAKAEGVKSGKEEGKKDAMKALLKAANVNWTDKDGKPYTPTPEQVGKRFSDFIKDAGEKNRLEKENKKLSGEKENLAQELSDVKDKAKANEWLVREVLNAPDKQLWNDMKVYCNQTGWRCSGNYAGVEFNHTLHSLESEGLRGVLTSMIRLPYNMATAADAGLREMVAAIFMGYVTAQAPAGGGGGGGSDDNWWKRKDEDWYVGAFKNIFHAAQVQLGQARSGGGRKK